MIRCVAFDFGEVLSSADDLYTAPAARLGVDSAAYEASYWEGRRAYDNGGSDAAYWTPLLTRLGRRPSPELITAMARLDASLWARMRPAAREILADVRLGGTKVAILSNAPFVLDMTFAQSDYAEDADYWFVSASMGMSKPDLGVYLRVEEVTECTGGEIAFVDDRPENVHAARERGWLAHLFVSDEDTRSWLAEIGVLADQER